MPAVTASTNRHQRAAANSRSNKAMRVSSGHGEMSSASRNSVTTDANKKKKKIKVHDYYGKGNKTMKETAKFAAKEAKHKGNAAFKNGDWAEAVKQYTRALKVDQKDYVCLSNRSAAHLKNKNANKALEDAEKCIKLNGKYAKGHIRKAGALHFMKKYTAEIKAYQQALLCCPGEQILIDGLEQAKRARSANSKASHAARKTEATLAAATSVRRKANRSHNVTEFVKQTKSSIELQIASLQAQLDMVKELEKMQIDEKLELLYTLLDKDKDGNIDAKELADGLRKRSVGLSFADAIEKSVELVAMYDEDGDAVLNRQEFENFVTKMVREMDITADEFCEFLVYQLLFQNERKDEFDDYTDVDVDDLKEEVKERGQLLGALHDPRMESLFCLFDRDGDGVISFREVACGLFHLTKNMEESTKATTSLLLMMDVDDKRQLEFGQFAKLILAIAAAAGNSFEEVANDLTHAITTKEAGKLDKESMRALTLAERDYRKARQREEAERAHGKIMDALSYGRTTRLFDLWDENNDGVINFEELFAGLQRYQAAAAKEQGVIIDAEKVAFQLMSLDKDGDNCLDKEEFATAMVTYADAMKTDLHQLIDFMCVVTALGEFL